MFGGFSYKLHSNYIRTQAISMGLSYDISIHIYNETNGHQL